jgi:thiamine monophosphate synthase
VHDLNEGVRVALDGGVDYLLFGTVFPTSSKPGRVAAGLDQLAAMVGAVPLPVLAVGGVTSDRASRIAATGAAGLAAIEMFAAGDLDLLRVRVYQASVAFDTLDRNSP